MYYTEEGPKSALRPNADLAPSYSLILLALLSLLQKLLHTFLKSFRNRIES